MKNGKSLLNSVTGGALMHCGGEASVYLLDAAGGPYVLKWFREGFSFDENIVDVAYKVRCPGLYRIEEWGLRDGTPYIIYDFVDGVPSDKINRVPVAVALVALRQVASTLAVLRKKGVSHGDLNPSNVIFVVEKGARASMAGESAGGLSRAGGMKNVGGVMSTKKACARAQGLDWAHALRTVVIDCGIVGPGMLAYAAPERFQGKSPDEKSDLFSLGLLLYRWVAGVDLVCADGYEQFAERMSCVQYLDFAQRLYATGAFDSPDGALQLSALEPLWRGLLRTDVSDRVESLDELDELIEIALDKVVPGDVALGSCVKNFIGSSLLNVAQKVPDPLENGLPFESEHKNKWLKWSVWGILILILVLMVLLFSSGTMRLGIDATGDLLLKRSRTTVPTVDGESVSEPKDVPDIKFDSLLLELPVPSSK